MASRAIPAAISTHDASATGNSSYGVGPNGATISLHCTFEFFGPRFVLLSGSVRVIPCAIAICASTK